MAETVISLYTKLGANHHFSVMCEMRRKQLLPCMMKLGASHHFSVYGNMAHATVAGNWSSRVKFGHGQISGNRHCGDKLII